MSKLKEICKTYFKLFSEKNIIELSNLFSNDVVLRDWEVSVNGKESVMTINKNIFDSFKSIDVKPIFMYEDRNTIISELVIELDNNEKIYVVDIISFNKQNKIKSIKAYKGN